MHLFLVQHGIAKSEAEDPERPLTEEGTDAVRRMGAWAAGQGLVIDQIRHSGKRRAAETAGASEYIDRLPQGYDTPLGRSGGRLSVGQKQRLSIARALVREAPVLRLQLPAQKIAGVTEHSYYEVCVDPKLYQKFPAASA